MKWKPLPANSPFRVYNDNMKVSGREVAQKILDDLKRDISQNNLKPGLAIILAGSDPSSEIYVNRKMEEAGKIGINATVYKFSENEKEKCLEKIGQLNNEQSVSGIIVQYPVYPSWNFDEISPKVDPQKDVDGFVLGSPFFGATALGVWEMLQEFAKIEGQSVENFLEDKKIIMVGKGKAAGGPIIKLLQSKGFKPLIVDSKTENRDQVIRSGDVVISATGRKHIVNGANVKNGSFIIGVGVGKEEMSGKTFGDINQKEIEEKVKLYCPTIGGIGPLTVACLLKNVVESSKKVA